MSHAPVLRTDLTLPQVLREQARANPGRIAVRQKEHGIWKPVTWAALHQRALHVGLGLRVLGVGEGGLIDTRGAA